MEQVLVGGYYDQVSPVDEYNSISAGSSWIGTETTRKQCIPADGKLKSMFIKISGAPGGGKSYTFHLMLNGNPTALAVTISGAVATTGNNTVNEIIVAPGDKVSLKVTDVGGPGNLYAYWSLMFVGDNPAESIVLGSIRTDKTGIRYSQISNTASAPQAGTDIGILQICPTDGTLKDMYIEQNQNAGQGSFTYTLRVNQIDTLLAVTITHPAVAGNNVADDIPVVAGDELSLKITPAGAPTNSPYAAFGVLFAPDIDGESILLGGILDNLDTGFPDYHQLCPVVFTQLWTNTNGTKQQGLQECTLKKLYVEISNAPGGGRSYTITVQREAADSTLVAVINDPATTANDIVHEVAVSNYDTVGIESVPAGVPAGRQLYWGVVSFRGEEGGIENKSANMGSKMVAAGLI